MANESPGWKIERKTSRQLNGSTEKTWIVDVGGRWKMKDESKFIIFTQNILSIENTKIAEYDMLFALFFKFNN